MGKSSFLAKKVNAFLERGISPSQSSRFESVDEMRSELDELRSEFEERLPHKLTDLPMRRDHLVHRGEVVNDLCKLIEVENAHVLINGLGASAKRLSLENYAIT